MQCPAAAVAEQQRERPGACGLLRQEILPRSRAQHTAQVQGVPGRRVWRQRERRGDLHGPDLRQAARVHGGIVGPEPPSHVLPRRRRGEPRPVGQVVCQPPALHDRRERRVRGVAHVGRANEGCDVERPGHHIRLRDGLVGRELVDQEPDEQPVRAAARQTPDAGIVHEEGGLGIEKILAGVVQIPEHEVAERRTVPGEKQPCAEFLGVM